MSAGVSPRVAGLLAVAGAAMIAALASGRAELAVLAGPLVVFVGVGLVLAREPSIAAELVLERERLLEGGETALRILLRNRGSAGVELEFAATRSTKLVLEPDGPLLVRLAGHSEASIELLARPLRWGAHTAGPLVVRARDPLGLVTWSGQLGRQVPLRVFPREQRLRELVAPLSTQPFLGTHVARARGEGIEFADIRPFAVGDRVRRVNWRATARLGALYVNEHHPEQASDVVLLLDTFAEAQDEASGTLDDAVRAAASLAREHLARRDRVALVDIGGILHWLEPAFGTTQLYRIIDALLASKVAFSYAWRAVDSIPRRVLPPHALIVAITPLVDERSIRLITELRRRGDDVSVVEVSPLTRVRPGQTATQALAYRLWVLEREALRGRLQALGIGVAVWDGDLNLGPALEGVNSFRRSARPAARA